MTTSYVTSYQLRDFEAASDGDSTLLAHLLKASGKLVLRKTLDELGIPFSDDISSYVLDSVGQSMAGGRASSNRKPRFTKRKFGRKKRLPVALRGYTIPFHKVYLWADMSGGTGVWYIGFKIKSLVKEYSKTFDEFKVKSLRITYLPNNNSSATGIYSSVLLDQGGFGAASSGTEKGWFRTLATMPGAKVTHRNQNNTYYWKPTEASANNWYRPETDTDYTVCTIYFADNGQESVELGGVLKISGHLLGRGMYWDAPAHVRQRRIVEQHLNGVTTDSLISTFEQLGG